jgi:membrane fusion protein (multidrug efflux system)
METETIKKTKRKSLRVYLPVSLVILIVATAAWMWYKEYAKYISTDDAYVDADKVSVSSKILGRIVKLYVDEGDSVKKNQLLAEMDSTDLVAQKNQMIAMKQQAIASSVQAEARYKFDQESIKLLEINLEKASDDYNRAQEQFKGNVITQEQYDHLKKAYQSAQAQLEAAKTQLDVSRAMIASAKASVESAEAQIQVVRIQLKNTKLYAPETGVVAKRWLLPGDIAQPGQSIFTLYTDTKFWVLVYLQETKLEGVSRGQEVMFTIDAFEGVTFYGKVFFIGSNTASQFSLIPPNNASGNFTKVTQRVPIKISIDRAEKGNINQYRLLAGMSVIVKIIK